MLMRSKARASTRGVGCGTRLEGILEESANVGWGCKCGACRELWEVVGDNNDEWKEEEEVVEMEMMRWALETWA